MTQTLKLILAALIAFSVVLGGMYLVKSGAKAQQNADLKVAVKTAQKETKNATKNATISKQTASATTADKAKAKQVLKEITDAAKTAPARDCLTPEQLRRYNDPLGDAATAGGPGVSRGVPAGSAPVFRWDGSVDSGEPGGVNAGVPGLRAKAQRAVSAGEAAPQISIVEQRLKQFFPTEAGKQ